MDTTTPTIEKRDPVFVQLDSRNRISLGNMAKGRYFLATVEPDGTIVLVPAVVTPIQKD